MKGNVATCFGLNWKPTFVSVIHEYACSEGGGRDREREREASVKIFCCIRERF